MILIPILGQLLYCYQDFGRDFPLGKWEKESPPSDLAKTKPILVKTISNLKKIISNVI